MTVVSRDELEALVRGERVVAMVTCELHSSAVLEVAVDLGGAGFSLTDWDVYLNDALRNAVEARGGWIGGGVTPIVRSVGVARARDLGGEDETAE